MTRPILRSKVSRWRIAAYGNPESDGEYWVYTTAQYVKKAEWSDGEWVEDHYAAPMLGTVYAYAEYHIPEPPVW